MQGARNGVTAAQWRKEPSRTGAQTQHFGCFAVVLGLPLPAQDHVRRGPRGDAVS